jgi:predicted aspartyl protease
MREPHQITSASETESDDMGRFAVEVTVTNNEDHALAKADVISMDQIRRTRLRGVVDSGAAHLVLPGTIVKQLGFPDAGKVKVRYADHRIGKRQRVSNVLLELLGREAVFTAIVEPKRDTALIGAIVLEELDLVVDCTKQRLHPRDPDWIISEIE